MLQKLKNLQKRIDWQALKDVRTLGMLVFLAITLLTSWNSIKIIETNYKLQQQIALLEQNNRLRSLENENTQLSNNYYQTETYLELAARNFNKGQKGERLIIVPEEVARNNAPQVKNTDSETRTQKQEKPAYRQNLEDWLDFLFRKNS